MPDIAGSARGAEDDMLLGAIDALKHEIERAGAETPLAQDFDEIDDKIVDHLRDAVGRPDRFEQPALGDGRLERDDAGDRLRHPPDRLVESLDGRHPETAG